MVSNPGYDTDRRLIAYNHGKWAIITRLTNHLLSTMPLQAEPFAHMTALNLWLLIAYPEHAFCRRENAGAGLVAGGEYGLCGRPPRVGRPAEVEFALG